MEFVIGKLLGVEIWWTCKEMLFLQSYIKIETININFAAYKQTLVY